MWSFYDKGIYSDDIQLLFCKVVGMFEGIFAVLNMGTACCVEL